MLNDTINVGDGYSDAIICVNETSIPCHNRNLTHELVYNEELIINCRYYLEGIALTPISVFGMLGETSLNIFPKHGEKAVKIVIKFIFLLMFSRISY